ncbi:MAG: hypothetical protein M3Z26_00050 [Bacteroidota bacterium]|nr:hypothetical protein [Bacteroidota bacterium]
MEKQSVISYKIYSNERLKPVSFHGKEIHPLYIQVIYERKPIYFKSYFFDLLSKEKYALKWIAGKKIPQEKQIIQKEESLINFLIERQARQFSFDTFLKDYYYYGKDLLDDMDEGFKDYLKTFFEDEGKPQLGLLVQTSSNKIMSAELVNELKLSLKSELYKNMLENAPAYAPPYLFIYDFTKKILKQDLETLSVYEWEIFQDDLRAFLKKEYPQYSFKNVQEYIRKLISK